MGLAARAAQAEGRPVEPLMRLPPGEGFRVALTFDACPGLFDARVAQAVVAAGAPASVFLTALWMRRNPEGLAYLLAHPEIFTL
jgi:peptidoglycan/xylan/chitin deacetylase (PgdA/CDA1 family)